MTGPTGEAEAEAAAALPPLLDALLAGARLAALDVRLTARSFLSWTFFRRRERGRRPLALPPLEPIEPGVWRLRLEVPAPEPTLGPAGAGAERAVARPTARGGPGPGWRHLELRLPAAPGERFVGFGERFHAVDQRGWRLETWTEEGAIGLGERLSRWLTRLGARWNPFPKGPTTAYKPLPWWISSRGYAVLIDTSAPVFFDVAASDPGALVAEIAAPGAEVYLFTGAPLALVQALVRRTGRPPGLPDWALAPWHDAIGGEERVRATARLLREQGIPSGVIWTEDWQGGRFTTPWLGPWSPYDIFPVYRRPCPRLYPALPELARDLHDDGYRFLGYFYPYVAAVDPDYGEAAARGFFVRDARRAGGRPATVHMLWYRTGQVDLTSAEARAWYRGFLEAALRSGFDGWMGDFGEYTPLEAVTASGEPGLTHRNRYPRLWAELQRDAIRAAGREGDAVFFSRSASIGQQGVTPIFWSGDSNTDFERWDGLPSNLRGLLSAGLSGMPIWTVDAGGYTSLWTRARDRETLARWTELGAFLAVLRTHHGTHPRRSVQLDRDATTLAHHRTYARLHAALFPLRRALVDEAARAGTPVARALLLHHPDDEAAWEVEDELLLGEHLLVAPVVERGARARLVYLPRGHRWVELWTGVVHEGGARVTARAALGAIPLFLRADGCLPTFDTEVDTFERRARVRASALRTLDDAERSLALIIGPEWRGPTSLYDGGEVSLVEGGRAGGLAGARDAVAALAQRERAPHALIPDALAAQLRPLGCGEGAAGVLALGAGRGLRVRSPIARRFTVYAVGG